jgi:hypothetical protein
MTMNEYYFCARQRMIIKTSKKSIEGSRELQQSVNHKPLPYET